MPNAQTYGELKRDVDDLLDQMARVEGNMITRRNRLWSLRLSIAATPDGEPLGGAHGHEVRAIDKASQSLSSIVNPEEIWPC